MGVGFLHELPARRRARAAQMARLVFLRRADIEHVEAAPRRLRRATLRSVRLSMRAMPQRAATRAAASLADLAARLRLTSGGRRVAPCTTSKPARCQAMVPSFSDTILLRTPALISDCAPMMLRVRPPQLTMTVVSGDGMRSAKR